MTSLSAHLPKGLALAALAIGFAAISACVEDVVQPLGPREVGPPRTATILGGDTIIQIGESLQMEAEVFDSAGNRLANTLTWTSASPVASVSATGTVTGNQFGSTYVRLGMDASAPALDSLRVVVVPRATLAWAQNGFVRIGDLTGRSQLLTPGEGRHLTVSPSGERWMFGERAFAYFVDRSGTTQLFKLPNLGVGPQWMDFSADEEWIYLRTYKLHENFRVYRVRADGSSAEAVAPFFSDHASPSPDPSKFAYLIGRDLFVRDRTANTTVQVGSELRGHRWSPDGQWIAFSDPEPGLGLMRPDGTSRQRVGVADLHPDIEWSPDSRYVIGVDVQKGMVVFEIGSGKQLYLGWNGRYPAWSDPAP